MSELLITELLRATDDLTTGPSVRDELRGAENLLNRNFEVESVDSVWVSDITYIWTDEGWGEVRAGASSSFDHNLGLSASSAPK